MPSSARSATAPHAGTVGGGGDARQQRRSQRRGFVIPDSLWATHPEGAAALRQLLLLEGSVEVKAKEETSGLKEALTHLWDGHRDIPSAGLAASEGEVQAKLAEYDYRHLKRVRLYLFHSSNASQQSAAFHPPGGMRSDPPSSLFIERDVSRTDPPSWIFKMHCTQIQDRNVAVPARLSHYFSKIVISSGDKAHVWSKRTSDALEGEGLEVKRIGSEEVTLQILLFLNFRTPAYSFSDELTAVIGTAQGSMPGVIKKIWKYARNHSLLDPSEEFKILCDPTLSRLFGGKQEVEVKDISSLVASHLLPPEPIRLEHTINPSTNTNTATSSSGPMEWTESEVSYDFILEAPETIQLDVARAISAAHPAMGLELDAAMKEISRQEELLHQSSEQLSSAIKRRNFLIAFAADPIDTIELLLNGQLHPSSLIADPSQAREHRRNDNDPATWRQAWVLPAAQRFLDLRRREALERAQLKRKREEDEAAAGLGRPPQRVNAHSAMMGGGEGGFHSMAAGPAGQGVEQQHFPGHHQQHQQQNPRYRVGPPPTGRGGD